MTKPPPTKGLSLSIDDVSRRFERRWALVHVSAEVPAGGGLMLVGANGSGKTTLLRCLATALKPHDGTIRFGGEDLWEHRDTLRPKIAFVSHHSRLYDDLSAMENLAFWQRLASGPTADPRTVLERVGLEDRPDSVSTYSAGMKRRLALAIALLKKPTLMLLDEPFASLDPRGRAIVTDVVKDLREAGTTFVIATHLPEEARPFCDQVLQLDSGQVVS